MGGDSRHQRSQLAALTPAGQAAYDEALRRWRSGWTSMIEEIFPEEDIVETTKRLRLLRGALQSQLDTD